MKKSHGTIARDSGMMDGNQGVFQVLSVDQGDHFGLFRGIGAAGIRGPLYLEAANDVHQAVQKFAGVETRFPDEIIMEPLFGHLQSQMGHQNSLKS